MGATVHPSQSKPRMFYIDNLRILLIILVISHHIAITYGAPGGWYYRDGEPGALGEIILTLFVAVNQSFFMGFFFMISGYFVPGSFDRKGAPRFLKDRAMRLGIPLVFYMAVIDPLLTYLLSVKVDGLDISLWVYLKTGIANFEGPGVGPLWFVEALLIFNILYVLWRLAARVSDGSTRRDSARSESPGNVFFAIFALGVGAVTFVVRIWLPEGWSYRPMGLQFPYFPQYAAMFVLGIVAYRKNWFKMITDPQGKLWLWITVFLIVVVFPIMAVVSGAMEGETETIRGGFHWHSLVFSVWQQLICVGMVICLLTGFRRRLNGRGRLSASMSASAYTMFIIHAPVAVVIALSLKNLSLYPLVKFPLVAAIVVWLCFLLAILIRKLPFTRRIL
jgi:glucan biosynthesis protein C